MKERFFSVNRLPLGEVIFNIIICFTFISVILCIIIGLVTKLSLLHMYVLGIIAFILGSAFYLVNYKNLFHIVAYVMCFSIGCVFLPCVYLLGGGVHGGIINWFIWAAITTCMIIPNKIGMVICTLEIILYTGCIALEYYHPEYIITLNTRRDAFIYTCVNLLLSSIVAGLVIRIFDKVNLDYQRKAYQDQMTGLFNRSAYEEKIQLLHEIDNMQTIIMLVDLNNLKTINDKFGHLYGDEAISLTAELLKKNFNHRATCYRIGGDEFCVIAEMISEMDFMTARANFLENIKEKAKGLIYPFSVASGYKRVEKNDIDRCVLEADKHMYYNKTSQKMVANNNVKLDLLKDE